MYTGIEMELTSISEFRERGAEDPLFRELADIAEANNGLWCSEAEPLLLEPANLV